MAEHQEPRWTPNSEDGEAAADSGAPLMTDDANPITVEEGGEMERTAVPATAGSRHPCPMRAA